MRVAGLVAGQLVGCLCLCLSCAGLSDLAALGLLAWLCLRGGGRPPGAAGREGGRERRQSRPPSFPLVLVGKVGGTVLPVGRSVGRSASLVCGGLLRIRPGCVRRSGSGRTAGCPFRYRPCHRTRSLNWAEFSCLVFRVLAPAVGSHLHPVGEPGGGGVACPACLSGPPQARCVRAAPPAFPEQTAAGRFALPSQASRLTLTVPRGARFARYPRQSRRVASLCATPHSGGSPTR